MENSQANIQNMYGDIFTIIGASGGSIDVSANLKDCVMGKLNNHTLMIDTSPLNRLNNQNMFGEIDAEANMPISTVGVVNTLIKLGIIEREKPFDLFHTKAQDLAEYLEERRMDLLEDKTITEKVILGEKSKQFLEDVQEVEEKQTMEADGKEFA